MVWFRRNLKKNILICLPIIIESKIYWVKLFQVAKTFYMGFTFTIFIKFRTWFLSIIAKGFNQVETKISERIPLFSYEEEGESQNYIFLLYIFLKFLTLFLTVIAKWFNWQTFFDGSKFSTDYLNKIYYTLNSWL